MNSIPFISAVFQHVVEATIFGSILTILIAVIQWVIGRRIAAAWRHALWLLVIVRLLVPILPESRFSVFNLPHWIKASVSAPRRVTVSFLQAPPTMQQPMEIESTVPENDFSFSDSELITTSKARFTLREAVALLWLCVTLLLLLRLVVGSCWLRVRLAQQRAFIDPSLIKVLSEARAQMKMRCLPRLVETSCVDSPGLFGALRPRILLPRGIVAQLSDTELRHVFLHELAHLKRGDLWGNLLMSFAHTLHWFNPLVWFVLRRMRLERELACDALVLRMTAETESHSYGQTILKLLETIRVRPSLSPVVGMLEEKYSAASRLTQITQFNARKSPSSLPGMSLLLVLAAVGLSNAQTEKPARALEKSTPSLKEPLTPDQKTKDPEIRSGLQRLNEEYERQQAVVKNLQRRVDDLRVQLRISDAADYSSDTETLRNLERDHSQAQSRVTHFRKITNDLKGKDRKELRKVIPTAAPDAAMDRYLGDLAKAEQQYASNISDLGPQHPEIQKLTALIKTINQQIEDRIDGVLAGLDLQVAQAQAVVEELEKRLALSRAQTDTRKSKDFEEYSRLKATLENERAKSETLYRRLEAEKVDSKIAPAPHSQSHTSANESVDASIAIHDARVLMEMGKLDEAETKLRQVVKDDPNNRQAAYYLKLINERRVSQAQRDALNSLTDPLSLNKEFSNPGRKKIVSKLETIIVPEFHVSQATKLSEVLKELGKEVRENDPEGTGVNFIIANPTNRGFAGEAPAINPQDGRELLRTEDFEMQHDVTVSRAPLKDVLWTLAEGLHPPNGHGEGSLVYRIEDYAVVFNQVRADAELLYTRTYKLNPNTVLQNLDAMYFSQNPLSKLPGGLAGSNVASPHAWIERTNAVTAVELLRNYFSAGGLNFEHTPATVDGQPGQLSPSRKAMFFNDKTGILMVRATLADLDIVENALQVLNMSPPQIMIETRFVKLNAGAAYRQDLLLRLIATNQASNVITVTELMSDPQFKALMEALGNREHGVPNLNRLDSEIQNGTALNGVLTEKQLKEVLTALKEDGVEVLACPKITTLSGRAAQVQVDPGPSAAVLPVVEADGEVISLSAEVDVPADRKRNLTAVKAGAKARVWDGQTLAFRAVQRNGESIIVLLTSVIIDRAGNRVHAPGTFPDEGPPPAKK